jgi:hypothetical protein
MKVFDRILVIPSFVPIVKTADANGTGVDTRGYSDGMLSVIAGDIDLTTGDETYVINLEESDDNSTFTAVSGYSITITADNQAKELRIADLNVTRKRYLRAVLDVGGTTPSIPICASFILGEKHTLPVGNA